MKAVVNREYTIIPLDDDLEVVTDFEKNTVTIEINQLKGDELEVWIERPSDGFLFVYCNRLEIGYWVTPKHVTITA